VDLEQYRQEVEVFLGELDKESYLHFAGHKEEANFSGVYEKHKELFTRSAIEEIQELEEKASSREEKRRLSYLLLFSMEHLLGQEVKEIQDQIAMEEARAKIDVRGQEIGYRYSHVVQMNEPDPEKRALIESRRVEATEQKLNPHYVKLWEQVHSATRDLGYQSYARMFSSLKRVDFQQLAQQLEPILDRTDDLYRENMDHVLRQEIGIPVQEVRRSDIPYLMRGKEFDAYFRPERMMEVFYHTLQGLGVDLDEQKNIIVDAEPREKKSPRAFCAPVKVPQEIYLVIMPSGGQDDYEAFFHEGGHAQHFANVSSRQAIEYRYLGDNSVTEAYAFLFDHLPKNGYWLERMLGIEKWERFLRFSHTLNLLSLRRYVGKLQYELKLHDGTPLEGKDELYTEILSRSVLVEYPKEMFLKDVDECFYCANYLRAWILEAQLEEYLKGEYGEAWFGDKKAGDFLRELWFYGQKYRADELAEELGYRGLDIDPLMRQVEDALS